MNPRLILTVLAAGLGCAHLALYLGAGPVDDDFICYRYARNLLRGHGLVYQPGERVEGFTNPLWVLLHAAGQGLGLAPVLLTRTLGMASMLLAVGFAELAERSLLGKDRRVPAAALAVAASPALAFHGAAGLGTLLFAALLLGWFACWVWAIESGRAPLLASLLLAAACLLRQEAALFALPFVLSTRARGGSLLPLLALAGWTAFRLVYYGDWMPLTWHVKRLPLAEDLAFGWRYLVLSTRVAGVGVFLLLALAAVRRGGRPRAGEGRSNSPMPAVRWALAGLLLHSAYVVASGGDYLALARFFVPTLPLALCLGAVGSAGLGWLRALWALACVATLWSHGRWESPNDLVVHTRAYLHVLHDFQEQRWASLGRHFGDVLGPDSSVCLSPIGAFGWESDLPIIDVLGLTDPQVAGAEPDLTIGMKGHHRYDARSSLSREPDYVILGNGVRDSRNGRVTVNPWERELYLDSEFQAKYRYFVAPIPGGPDLDVWIGPGAPPLPASRPAR